MRITHEFDPHELLMSLANGTYPRELPTSFTNEFEPQELPTRTTRKTHVV